MILQIVFSSVGLFLSLSVAVYFLINLKRIVKKFKSERSDKILSTNKAIKPKFARM